LAKTFAQLIRDELEKVPEAVRKHVILLFTAHSLPMKAVERGDPYPAEVSEKLVLRIQKCSLSFVTKLKLSSVFERVEAYLLKPQSNLNWLKIPSYSCP
jgi:protoheme ferro-lyase